MLMLHRKFMGSVPAGVPGDADVLPTLQGKVHCKDLDLPGLLLPGLPLTAFDPATDSRTQLFNISTNQVDNEGDSFDTSGWDLTTYNDNPIILWNHDYDTPIGKALTTYIDGDSLKSVGWFYPPDLGEFGWFADSVWRMVKAGLFRTASVGYLPLVFSVAPERKTPLWPVPLNYKKQRLLEWSIAPVPSNPGALADTSLIKAFGIDMRQYHGWLEKQLDGTDAQLDAAFLRRPVLENVRVITKSLVALQRTRPTTTEPTVADTDPKPTVKAGRKLSAKSLAHVKEMRDHHQACMKAMEGWDKCMKSLEEAAALTTEADGSENDVDDAPGVGAADSQVPADQVAGSKASPVETKASPVETKVAPVETKAHAGAESTATTVVENTPATPATTPPVSTETQFNWEAFSKEDIEAAYAQLEAEVIRETVQEEIDKQRGRL
jgi:hypothetical protein